MAFPASLSPSPVHLAFTGIQWDPLGKLELTGPEKSLLRSAEDNVLDYSLAEQDDAAAYARLLLKVLDQVIGPNNPSDKVAKLNLEDILDDEEALQMLYVDPMGVVSHYALSKLYEVILFLKEKSSKSAMSVSSTFYKNGVLIEEWRPLLRILKGGAGTGDAYAQRVSALCLACILFEGCPSQRRKGKRTTGNESSSVMEALQSLVSWIASRLQSSTSTSLALVTPALAVLIAAPEARKLFDQAGGIGFLVRHLRVRQTGAKKNSASVQHLYELCFCLWIMTYECSTSDEMRSHFHRDQAVFALVDLVATAPREKVVRVALSSLRNLATCSDDELPNVGAKTVDGSTFLGEMIGCGLIKSIDLMKERQWTDPDIVEDLDALHKMLHENYHDMTRWDVYKSEVESGHLQWGIVHTEKFFKENSKRMEGKDGNFAIVKVLIGLAASSATDEEVAAIACYDIGEFVRNYPNGRAIVKRLGAKEIVMKLIEHENPELQRHALQCVSKMLVNNWQAVR